MTQERFAGFDLNKVFEDSEAEKAKEEKRLADEEKKRKLKEKLDAAKRKTKPAEESVPEPTPEPAAASPIIVPVDYENLQIEQLSPRDANGTKILFTYDKSLADLRTRLKNPNARHLGHREAFGIIIDGLEGRLEDPKLIALKNIYTDLVSGYGEWLSLAMQRKGYTLYCYEKPEGLVWNGSNYVQNNFTYSGQPKTFDIAGI